MRIDIHIHSSYSNDGSVSPEEILRYAKKIGLDGIAITDHNELAGSLKLWKENKDSKDFVVIPGMEVSSSEGHILALGIKEPIARDLTPGKTIEQITNLGGIAIAPHPYRFWSGMGEESVKQAGFEAIEVLNSRSHKAHNKKAKNLAEKLKCGETGGSDCHSLSHLGDAYLELEDSIYNYEDILEEIRNRRTTGAGNHREISGTPKYIISCVYLWLKRGMKRI